MLAQGESVQALLAAWSMPLTAAFTHHPGCESQAQECQTLCLSPASPSHVLAAVQLTSNS